MQVYTYMQINAKLSICPQLRHFSLRKANCTKAMKKQEQTFYDYNKNKGTEVPVARRMRITAELVEHVELSKNKLKELTDLVDNFIALIK